MAGFPHTYGGKKKVEDNAIISRSKAAIVLFLIMIQISCGIFYFDNTIFGPDKMSPGFVSAAGVKTTFNTGYDNTTLIFGEGQLEDDSTSIILPTNASLYRSQLYADLNQPHQFGITASFDLQYSTSAAWGDYDNDGDQDLVVGNYYGQNNYLYRNDGQYGFTKIDPCPFLYGNTQDVEWGDFNNDGNLDLAVGNYDYQNNKLYINNGGGRFTETNQFGQAYTTDLEWADCDNDGDLDMALGAYGQNYLYVNTGSGNFLQLQEFGSDPTYCLAWGDYDNDGDLDMAVGNNGQNYLYENGGDIGFIALPRFGVDYTRDMAWTDVNNDGYQDLIVANYGAASRVYLNNGNKTFSEIDLGYTVAISAAAGDLNRDGWQDFVLGMTDDTQSRVYLNNKNNTFSKIPLSEKSYTSDVALADFDKDGDLDLALANWNRNSRLFGNNYLCNFEYGIDLGNDGIIDNTIPDYYMPADGSKSSINILETLKEAQCFAAGDADNDGDLDLAAGFNGKNMLYINQGNSGFEAKECFGTGDTRAMVWGDFDLDGDLDLAAGIYGSQNLYFKNIGGCQFLMYPKFGSGYTTCMAAADVDLDGDLDLAVGKYGQQNMLYLNQGLGIFLDAQRFGTGLTTSMVFADEDLDGDLDLAVGCLDKQFWLYRNDRGGEFGAVGLPSQGSIACMDWADYDGDGDVDLAFGIANTSESKGQNLIYKNERNNFFTQTDFFGNGNTTTMQWGDLESDGDMDMLVCNKDQLPTVYINQNKTYEKKELNFQAYLNPGFFDPALPTSFNTSLLCDLNGDTILDIILGTNSSIYILLSNATFRERAILTNFNAPINDYIRSLYNQSEPGLDMSLTIRIAWIDNGVPLSKGPYNLTLNNLVIYHTYAPVCVPIQPAFNVPEDSIECQLFNVTQYFSDDLDASEDLQYHLWSELGSGIIGAYISPSLNVVIDAQNGTENDNWSGSFFICIEAFDSSGLSCISNWIKINIVNVYDQPVISEAIMPLTMNEGGTAVLPLIWPNGSRSFQPHPRAQMAKSSKGYFFDGDGDVLYFDYSVNLTNSSYLYASPDVLEVNLDNAIKADGFQNITIISATDWFGQAEITIYCDDDLLIDHTLYQVLNITVSPLNDEPIWKTIGEDNSISFLEDSNPDNIINFYDYIADVDTNISELKLVLADVGGSKDFQFKLGSNGSLSINTTPNYFGSTTIEVTVNDTLYENQTMVEIICRAVNDIPYTSLNSPLNNTIVTNTSIVLEWLGFDVDNSNLTYEVYLDALSGTTKIAEVINQTYFNLSGYTKLEPGKVYFWKVIPFDGQDRGNCTSGVFSFDLNLTKKMPTVSLFEPFNTARLNSTTVELAWYFTLDNTKYFETDMSASIQEFFAMMGYVKPGGFDVRFRLFVGTSLDNLQLYKDSLQYCTYKLTNLENGKTYYWKALPIVNNVTGICQDLIWSFTVDLDFKLVQNLTVTLNVTELTMSPGSISQFMILVVNRGNGPEKVFLTDIHNVSLEVLADRTEFVVLPLSIEVIMVTVSLNSTYTGNTLNLTIKASSISTSASISEMLKEYQKVKNTFNILITVEQAKPGPQKAQNGSEKPFFKKMMTTNNIFILIIIILLMILLVMSIYLFKTRRELHELEQREINDPEGFDEEEQDRQKDASKESKSGSKKPVRSKVSQAQDEKTSPAYSLESGASLTQAIVQASEQGQIYQGEKTPQPVQQVTQVVPQRPVKLIRHDQDPKPVKEEVLSSTIKYGYRSRSAGIKPAEEEPKEQAASEGEDMRDPKLVYDLVPTKNNNEFGMKKRE